MRQDKTSGLSYRPVRNGLMVITQKNAKHEDNVREVA